MPEPRSTVNTGEVRVWSITDRAGPANPPEYQGCWMADNPRMNVEDSKQVKCPDPRRYGKFKTVDIIPGDVGMAEVTIKARYDWNQDDLLEILRRRCAIDLQLRAGECYDPQELLGWTKILVMENAQHGNWEGGAFGAFDPSDQNPIEPSMPFKAETLYEVRRVIFQEHAESEDVQEVLAILVCDAIDCGECESPSSGCEKVFALTITVGGSPGAKAEIIYTSDGGTVWGDTEIDTLAVNEDPDDMACVGRLLVVISADSNSMHYAEKAEVLSGSETWTEIGTGFVAAKQPRAIFSLSPRHTWIVGNGGYVYFTDNPTAGVSVQHAGLLVTDDLRAVHAYDTENVLAVGESNAVLITRNGGATWASVTGPNPGQALLCCWMRGPNTWIVGCDDGTLWDTRDGGDNWTQKILPVTLSAVTDVKFSTPTVGWLAGYTATPAGVILRSIDGGYQWYVAPEETGISTPANDRINEVAICQDDPNVIYAGGLADDALDGIILKSS